MQGGRGEADAQSTGAGQDAEYKESKINWWDNVYGFDMSCIKKIATTEPLGTTVRRTRVRAQWRGGGEALTVAWRWTATVDVVDPNQVITDSVMLHEFNLATGAPRRVPAAMPPLYSRRCGRPACVRAQ